MRTSLDIPDALFRHLKARAAMEGRTLRDLVLDLVEKGLNAPEPMPAPQRLHARPLLGTGEPIAASVGALTNAALSNAVLSDLAAQDDDERARGFVARR